MTRLPDTAPLDAGAGMSDAPIDRDNIERLARLLEKDAAAQDFAPCEMTGLFPGDEYEAANALRCLLADNDAQAARVAALEAERGRLREALSLIAMVGFSDDPAVAKAIARQTVKQARAALAETEGE